jgi:hypothetical protein
MSSIYVGKPIKVFQGIMLGSTNYKEALKINIYNRDGENNGGEYFVSN